MQLAFILTMPGNNAWDGKWSGDGELHAVVQSVPDEAAVRVLQKRTYGYDFGDGWYAQIEVRKVDADEAAKLRAESKGFHGYQWMIPPIIDYGKIMPDDQIEEFLKAQREAAQA